MLCLLFSSCAAAGPEDGKSDSVLMMERIETVIYGKIGRAHV